MRPRAAVAAALLVPAVALGAAGCSHGSTGPHVPPRPSGSGRHSSPPTSRHRASTPQHPRGAGMSARGVAVVMPEHQVSQPSAPLADPLPKRPSSTARFTTRDGNRYVVQVWARATTRNCAAAAVGPAAGYLRTHPCSALTRVLAMSHVHGRAVAFAEQTLRLRSARAVHGLRPLVRRGPALIDTLFSAGYGLPAGPQSVPGLQFLIAARGRTLTTIYYWYVNQGTPYEDPLLERFARDMYAGFAAGRR